ncbi:serine/threonine-protein kinase [Arenimonas alkanexedens]
MTTHSICFAGLSREEEAEITTCFKQANASTGNHWLLTPETEAHVLVIDMDSMYGQMSLMKAIGSDKIVVALTAGGRADTDYVLQRPATADAIASLFTQILDGSPAAGPTPVAAEPMAAPIESAPAPAAPVVSEPEPAPSPAAPAPVAARTTAEQPVAPPQADPRLTDYLRPGALSGPVRLQLVGAPDLVLDPGTQTYLSGAALKPLLPYCAAVIRDSDLVPVSAAELTALAAGLGGSQPWSRLAWLSALSGGNGALANGFGLNDRYKLLRWPQTEREFPKHFRIATVMMKAPALLTDIAEQSGVSLTEVIDYVNACLATGVAEAENAPAPAPDAGKGGLLGRFRR